MREQRAAARRAELLALPEEAPESRRASKEEKAVVRERRTAGRQAVPQERTVASRVSARTGRLARRLFPC